MSERKPPEQIADFEKIYLEEDLFPKRITAWSERPYGLLFYNDDNKDSYDSNHAVVFRNQVKDLRWMLDDIVQFYSAKGIKPSIYQSISDDGFFEEIRDVLEEYDFDWWTEEQSYMVLSAENAISPNPQITVEKVSQWDDAYATHIFEASGEPWEIPVAKKVITDKNTLFFIAQYGGIPVGMTYGHIADGVCRVDYLLVSKAHRNIGVGRAIIHSFVKYCNENQIESCYLWPDGETAERIYYEAGFRLVATKQAGRACLR